MSPFLHPTKPNCDDLSKLGGKVNLGFKKQKKSSVCCCTTTGTPIFSVAVARLRLQCIRAGVLMSDLQGVQHCCCVDV